MWRTHVGTAFGLAVLLTVTMLYAMAPHIVDWAFDTYDARGLSSSASE